MIVKIINKNGVDVMNELQMTNKDDIRISSREVAKMMGIRHGDLLDKIDKINDDFENGEIRSQKYWIEGTYKVPGNNKAYREYQITKLGCEFLAHKSTGTKGNLFTARYMDRFQMMEEYINNQIPQLSLEDQAVLNIINANDKLDKALAIKDYKDIIEKPLIEEIDELKELNNKFKVFISKDGLIDVDTFSKVLAIKELGRNNMYKWFRNNKYLMKNNRPYQHYINQELFKLKNIGYKTNYIGEQIPLFKTYITKKGLGYFLNKFVEDGYITFTNDTKNN